MRLVITGISWCEDIISRCILCMLPLLSPFNCISRLVASLLCWLGVYRLHRTTMGKLSLQKYFFTLQPRGIGPFFGKGYNFCVSGFIYAPNTYCYQKRWSTSISEDIKFHPYGFISADFIDREADVQNNPRWAACTDCPLFTWPVYCRHVCWSQSSTK